LKHLLRKDLEAFGITHSFIYPGLEGICKEIKFQHFDPVRNGRHQIGSAKLTIEIPNIGKNI
jgi:hypothetical protein